LIPAERVALTLGDPNGVGPEISLRSLERLDPVRRKRVIVIGADVFLERLFGGLADVKLLPVNVPGYRVRPGIKDPLAGEAAYRCISEAASLALSHACGAIVTAPLSKETVVSAGHPDFVDHTTFFGRAFGVPDPSMLFDAPDMRVILATIHLPLSKVSEALTRETVSRAVSRALDYCRKALGIEKPRVVVCGLNPHAGEGGLLGTEEAENIAPAVLAFREAGELVEGPLPADTVFPFLRNGKWDIAVAAYHDQGLTPFKLLHFHDGVNVTLGLPVVRTSPDHGTAWDLAGTGRADHRSMDAAIDLAFRLLDASGK
jgi:4-hydroxythreonine-4-phosphate dehydrogenase